MLPKRFTADYLHQLELFKLRARRAFLGARQGGHLSLRRGQGIEFSDYRKYELGDSPRWIDWGVYARTDRLYVKQYQEEQNLSVLILLDGSASMNADPDDQKWEYARDLALSLAYVALIEQDSVVMATLGGKISPHCTGARALHTLGELCATAPKSEHVEVDLVRETQRAVSRVRFPGIAIVLSDFLFPNDQLQRIFGVLRAKNLEVNAIQVLGAHDQRPHAGSESVIAIDSENGEEIPLALSEETLQQYSQLLERHQSELRQYFLSNGISFSTTVASEQLTPFIIDALPQTGLIV